jgi:hypothetical protein
MNPPLRLLMTYQEHQHKAPDLIVQVPGREMWVAGDVIDSHEYTIYVPDLGGKTIFDRRSAKLRRTIRSRPLPRWARYLAGVLQVLSEDDVEMPGAILVIAGDEPIGPRYDHALGMAFVATWYEHHQRTYAVADLLDVMERIQKQYVE